jgi:hypothetical protein
MSTLVGPAFVVTVTVFWAIEATAPCTVTFGGPGGGVDGDAGAADVPDGAVDVWPGEDVGDDADWD